MQGTLSSYHLSVRNSLYNSKHRDTRLTRKHKCIISLTLQVHIAINKQEVRIHILIDHTLQVNNHINFRLQWCIRPKCLAIGLGNILCVTIYSCAPH